MVKLQLNIKYKIGLRAIKTALAVAVCALLSLFFSHEDIFAACVAAVICMERTSQQTINTGINRFLGTMIGGIVGYIALEAVGALPYYEWIRVILLPICVLVVVYICNLINRQPSVSIGCVVVIIILSRLGESTGSSTLIYVVQRVCDTLLGVLVATVINKFTFKNKKVSTDSKENLPTDSNDDDNDEL